MDKNEFEMVKLATLDAILEARELLATKMVDHAVNGNETKLYVYSQLIAHLEDIREHSRLNYEKINLEDI